MDNKQIIWTNEKRRLGDLIPWEDNPRQITKEQAERLERSISKFGYSQPIEIEPDNTVVDGHQRKPVMLLIKEFGADAKIDVRVSSRKMSLEERLEYVALKHEGAVGEWDWDGMHDLYAGDELVDFGFDIDELEMHGFEFDTDEPEPDPEVQIDRAEELREKWGVETGQLWRLGEHRLICGDCTDAEVVARVMQGEKAGVVVTDPPYNVMVLEDNDNMTDDEFIEWCKKWSSHLPSRRILTVGIKKLLLWGEILGNPQWIISWVKMNGQGRTGLGGGNGKWDPVLLYDVPQDCGIDVLEINNDYRGTLESGGFHLTGKPLELWELLITRFGENIVLDPFLGSGTTLIACERLGRKCRAVEISPAYCAVAIQRWVDMTDGEPELINT